MLSDKGEFGWISAQHGSHLNVSVKNDPGEAAREVAQFGGLPLEIKRFYNVEAPKADHRRRFNGTWGEDQLFFGKGALNCHEGKAISTDEVREVLRLALAADDSETRRRAGALVHLMGARSLTMRSRGPRFESERVLAWRRGVRDATAPTLILADTCDDGVSGVPAVRLWTQVGSKAVVWRGKSHAPDGDRG